MRTQRCSVLAGLALGVAGWGVLGSAGAAAAAGEPLTLAAAAERALAAHPSLSALRARGDDAAAALGEAAAGGRIAARWLTTLTEHQEPMLVSPIHSFGPGQIPPFDETLIQSTVSAQVSLWDAGARRSRIDAARAQQAATLAGLSAAEQQLLARVAAAYVEVLTRRQVLAAAESRRGAVAAELERVGRLLAVGKVAEVENLRGEAALAGAEAELARLGSALDFAERELARLIGAAPEETRAAALEPLGAFAAPLPPREALLEAALEGSPEVAAARLQIAAAEAGRRLARAAYYPDLRVNAALQEFGSGDGHAATEWNAGFTLAVPLWDGGVTGQRVARAEAQRAEAEARLESARLEVASAVDRALAALDAARARTGALERAAARLAEVARVQQLLLDAGAGTQIDYLAAESELAAIRASLYEAQSATVLARVELGRILAQLSPAFLAAHLAAEMRP